MRKTIFISFPDIFEITEEGLHLRKDDVFNDLIVKEDELLDFCEWIKEEYEKTER